jgi:hypothetical protein
VNDKKGANNLYVSHQFNYENKFFEYNQATVPSTVGSQRLLDLDSYVASGINDQTL